MKAMPKDQNRGFGYGNLVASVLSGVESQRQKEAQEQRTKQTLARKKKYKEIGNKILGSQEFKNHLYMVERLERRGVDRNTLVGLLALAATSSTDRDWWREEIRSRVAALRRLSGRLETVLQDATKLLADPFCRVAVWRSILGNPSVTDPTKKSLAASFALYDLRSLAKDTAGQARVLGRFLRRAGRKYDRMAELFLLYYVETATRGEVFDRELAALLTDSFAALQQPSRVIPERLRKLRERYLPPAS